MFNVLPKTDLPGFRVWRPADPPGFRVDNRGPVYRAFASDSNAAPLLPPLLDHSSNPRDFLSGMPIGYRSLFGEGIASGLPDRRQGMQLAGEKPWWSNEPYGHYLCTGSILVSRR